MMDFERQAADLTEAPFGCGCGGAWQRMALAGQYEPGCTSGWQDSPSPEARNSSDSEKSRTQNRQSATGTSAPEKRRSQDDRVWLDEQR